MTEVRTKHIAYTDGSCSGNPGPGGFACLLDGQMFSGWHEMTTNNAMELMAAFTAVDNCPPNSELTIVTDSRLVIGWLAKGWKCNHQHLWEIIKAFFHTVGSKAIVVNFQKVKGHSGHDENHLVDREAVLQTKIGKNAIAARG